MFSGASAQRQLLHPLQRSGSYFYVAFEFDSHKLCSEI